MKSLALAAAVLLVASSAFAQNTPVRPPLYTNLDAPAAGDRVAPDVRFGGWAFNCKTGRHAASIVLARIDAGGGIVIVPAAVYWGPRPDVQAYATAIGCAAPELALGFTVVPNSPQPFGLYDYVLLTTDLQKDPDSINWTATIRRTVTVQ